MNIDLDVFYWDRVKGFISELRVDARWILRSKENNDPFGSLRIVSHPDLPPGHLRAIFMYITKSREKTTEEILKDVEDYKIDITELEVFSIDRQIETETITIEKPFKELEEIFHIKIFE